MMRYRLSLLPLLVTIVSLVVAAITMVAAAQTSAMSFDDEFNGPAGAAPAAQWQYDIGNNEGWGNEELQTYTNHRANSYLDGNGHLVIRAIREPDGSYTSARLITARSFQQNYGTFEARIRLDPKTGVWPAFWLLGEGSWPQHGEIDVMENYGEPGCTATVIVPKGNAEDKLYGVAYPDNQWHVWLATWTKGKVVFSIDGRVLTTIPVGGVYSSNQKFYLILNVAVGGVPVGDPSSTQFPVSMLVDYVRVYPAR